MQSVEIRGLDEILKRFDHLPEAVRAARIQTLEVEGPKLLGVVRGYIGTGPRRSGDTHAHVADVQHVYMGSGKGYVAVRAKAKTLVNGYAAGYVTNSLENGHVFARSGGRVSGKYMYHHAQPEADMARERLVRAIEDAAQKALNGG